MSQVTLTDLLPRVRAIVAGATRGPWKSWRTPPGEWAYYIEDDGGATIGKSYGTPEGCSRVAAHIALHDPELTAAVWGVVEAADDVLSRLQLPDTIDNHMGQAQHRLRVRRDALTTILARKLGEGGE